MSYIERAAVLELIQEAFHKTDVNGEEQMGVLKCHRIVREAPTADVVLIRHGKWIYHECVSTYDGCKSGYSCSACNAFVDEDVFDTDEFHKAFCGNCGAKMDGERSKHNE
ncbi:MAG: hypothetical protein IJ303_04315 [Clostridia bacterium]|nr:hypothetical protein [Clostridia bacterium]